MEHGTSEHLSGPLIRSSLESCNTAIWIGRELYYDGGVSSNTPIEALAEDLKPDDGRDTIVFLIDLWDRKGGIPRSLDEVLWRQKCIQYGSRKEAAVNVVNAYEKKGREAQHSAAKARSVSSDVRAPA